MPAKVLPFPDRQPRPPGLTFGARGKNRGRPSYPVFVDGRCAGEIRHMRARPLRGAAWVWRCRFDFATKDADFPTVREAKDYARKQFERGGA